MKAAPDSVGLGPIRCVTISTPSLAASEAAYMNDLGYSVIHRGHVSAAESALWAAPATEGAPTLRMAPPAGVEFVFRFVEQPAVKGYRAFAAHGWNAVELMVQDVDAMAAPLAASGFEIIAPPMDLTFCPDIRAMQIRGPAGEILYLTQFRKDVPGLEVPAPRCAVDRAFIVIVGGPSLDALQAWYSEQFAVPAAPVMESRVQAMALEFSLPREHRFRIAALPLKGRSYIEADEMPGRAAPLPERLDWLPPGISIVSFSGTTGNRALPVPDRTPPYAGAHSTACRRGAAGELLEIIG
jgi:hypothetical protein